MPHRIVSLIPAATEIACALGARTELVGVSHECDHPSDVTMLPAVTRARPAGPGGAAPLDLDGDLLARLAPTIIITGNSRDAEAAEAAAASLAGHPVAIVSLHPTRLADLWQDIRTTAAAIGRAAEGEYLVANLSRDLEGVRERARRALGTGQRPRVITIEWLDPVMLGGLWTPELVDLAGGECLGIASGEKARTMTREALARLEPEVVLVEPRGFPRDRALEDLDRLPEALPWDAWPAVATGRVFVADGNAYFNRPGPRLVDSAEIFAACLYPDEFFDVLDRYPGTVARIDADLTVHMLPDD